MKGSRTLWPGTLDEIIRWIVEVAKPDKIILFGSAARGELGPNSDVDLLVIKGGGIHRGQLTEEIYMNLFGVGQAVDVVVVTPEDVEQHRDNFALVIYPAMREGEVVYDAREFPSSLRGHISPASKVPSLPVRLDSGC